MSHSKTKLVFGGLLGDSIPSPIVFDSTGRPAILNDLNRGPGNILADSRPDPLPTNFPDSPNMDHLATGGAGVVPGPAIPLVYFGQSSDLDKEIGNK